MQTGFSRWNSPGQGAKARVPLESDGNAVGSHDESPFEFLVGFVQMKEAHGEEKRSPWLPLGEFAPPCIGDSQSCTLDAYTLGNL
jgi:hypothetical protein